MEKTTQETAIALLQQASVLQTATLVRIEGKVDSIDNALQRYVTIEHLEKFYVRNETHENLKEKVRSITWGLGVLFATILGFIANTIFKFIGGK